MPQGACLATVSCSTISFDACIHANVPVPAGEDVSRSASDAQLEARHAIADAEAARATAARLNARVTDLAASEAAAKGAAEAATKELQQAREQHAKELQTLEARYRRLVGPGVQFTVVAPSIGGEASDDKGAASQGRLVQGQAPVAHAVSKAREEQLQKVCGEGTCPFRAHCYWDTSVL
jgi:hypothetical protein